MHFIYFLTIAASLCATVISRTLTREEIFQLVSAGIPGVGSRYGGSGYYPHYPVYPGGNPRRRFLPAAYPRTGSNPARPYLPGFQSPNVNRPAPYQSCTQDDPSATFQLSSDNRYIPINAIQAELGKQVPLHNTLLTMKLDRSYQSYVAGQEFGSCKTTLAPLTNFYSAKHGGRCWVIPDYQEKVEFAICKFGTCNTCSNTAVPGLKPRCVKNFRYVSVWAFCEKSYQRIVYTRLIIPAYCTCQQIQC